MELDHLKDSARIGTIYEHKAINQFLRDGCHVFKNVMQHGPIDIVLYTLMEK